jgi:hypothetical protein
MGLKIRTKLNRRCSCPAKRDTIPFVGVRKQLSEAGRNIYGPDRRFGT